MASPREVIEAIRTELGVGLQTDPKAQRAIERLQDMNYRFLDTIAQDLYSKQNHFVLELIQNADDNEYAPTVTPFLIFRIDHEKIVVQNNETGFLEPNVRALCSVDPSTKTKALGYIGEKGIGFKSVFRISDRPQVFSNGFNFEFRKDDGQSNLGFVVPHWISDAPVYAEPDFTSIVLPLRGEAKADISKLAEIEPTLLLFLKNLRRIEVHDAETLVNWIERQDRKGKVWIRHPNGGSVWKIVGVDCAVPPNIHEKKREGVSSRNIMLGFPLNDNCTANTDAIQHVFAYLPTRRYGFKFIVQADFLVPASREDIHKDKPWNKWIRDNIANVFCEAVEAFKQDGKLKKSFYNYIPLTSEVTDSLFSPVVTQIHGRLREADCVLTESGHWSKPRDVLRANDDDIRALIPNVDLKRFFGREYMSSKIIAGPLVLNALGVAEFGLRELIEFLKNSAWLEEQSDDWFVSLYAYLSRYSLNKAQLQEFRKLPILRLTRNRLTSVDEELGPVFFPLDKKGYDFEGELRIIKRKLCEPKNKGLKAPVEKFLKLLGVSNATPYDIIEQHILPTSESTDENSNWQSKDNKVLVDYLRYIRDHLPQYLKERNQHKGTNEQQSVRHLAKAIWIRFIKQDTKRWHSKAEFLYLGKAYGNDNNLEELFQGINDDGIRFVDEQYVQESLDRLTRVESDASEEESAKKQQAELRGWKNFFVTLGIETRIRVCKTVEGSDVEYTSNDLKRIIETAEHPRIVSAIRILDENWQEYSSSLKAGYSVLERKSTFHKLLIESSWIPTTQKTLAKPSDLFLDKPEIRKILGESGTYPSVTLTNKNFVQAVGINTELTVEAVLNHLKNLVDAQNTEQSTYEQIYKFLDKQFDGQAESIKREFSRNRVIYVPDTSQRYYSAVEVLWKDASEICGSAFAYLHRHYPKLKRFFVESLGVNEQPSAKDYAAFLERLAEKESITAAEEKSVLRVYEELNRGLNPQESNPLISEELWWAPFICKPVFWTTRREFWMNEGDVLVANNPELYELFKDRPRLGFLKLASNYHLKIRHFLDKAGIPHIDRVASLRILLKEKPTVENEITSQVRLMGPFILRYLFQIHNDTYEALKANKRLDESLRTTCYSVKNLEVEYSLLGESVTAGVNAFLHEGNLYVDADETDDTTYSAIELAKHFENPPGLDDFLISLFEKKTEDKILKLLAAKKINALPPGELEHFGIGQPNELEAVPGYEDVMEVVDDVESEAAVNSSEHDEVVDFPADEMAGQDLKLEEPEYIEETPKTREEPFRDTGPSTSIASGNATQRASTAHRRDDRKATVGASRTLRPWKAGEFSEPDSQHRRSTPQERVSSHLATGDRNAEKVDWQPECKPEEADVRVEHFEGTRREFRESQQREARQYEDPRLDNAQTDDDRASDGLTREAKQAIGNWGERYALKYLREQFVKKYSSATLQNTYDGFNMWQTDRLVVQVQWLNRVADLGAGHDIKVKDQGREIFIEVKSTKTASKEWFDVSRRQWEFAEYHREGFYIYRVLNAGRADARLIAIHNPFRLWESGRLAAYPVRVFV